MDDFEIEFKILRPPLFAKLQMSLLKTLDSLEEFIEAQKENAARARSDAKRLELLKQKALTNPQAFIENLEKELEPFRTDDNNDGREPSYVDWSLYRRADPTPLHAVKIPPLRYHSEHQDDGTKSAPFREQMLPILEEYRTRVKQLSLGSSAIEEEESSSSMPPERPRRSKKRKRPLEEEENSVGTIPTFLSPAPELKSDDDRTLNEDAPASLTPPPPMDVNKNGRGAKPKPELFNVPWTAEEQRLLEKCLLEIPPTEKQRWMKISKAMGGIRTGRQVASRVQKYNLKLRKFGLEPPA